MTVESRMSFPEGGTECPPDETPLPASSVTTTCNNITTTTQETCTKLSNNTGKVYNGSNKSNKKAVSSQQRRKLRSHKTTPLLQVGTSDESSEKILKDITANSCEIDKDHKCTNDTSSSGEENAEEDLKKPVKVKPLGGNGGKEEAASRKSMRLLLRKGMTDNCDGSSGPKRPRYVEDLSSIDFDDDKHKVMFMHSLGMCIRAKGPKLDLSSESPGTSSMINLQRKEEISEIISEKKAKCKDNEIISTENEMANLAVLTNSGHFEDKHKSLPSTDSKLTLATANDVDEPSKNSLLATTVSQSKSTNNNDDNEGWECWMKRLSSSCEAKQTNMSPTKQEIKESLLRLIRLGTTVKVVVQTRGVVQTN